MTEYLPGAAYWCAGLMLLEFWCPSPKSHKYSFAPVDSLENEINVGDMKLLSDMKLNAAFGGSIAGSSDPQLVVARIVTENKRRDLDENIFVFATKDMEIIRLYLSWI